MLEQLNTIMYDGICWFQRSLLLIASLCGGVWLHSLFGTMLLRLFVLGKKMVVFSKESIVPNAQIDMPYC